MIASQQKLHTAEEFWQMTQQFGEKQYELIEGVILEMPPSNPRNSIMAMRIGRLIGNFVDEHKLGWVQGADGGYTLSPGTVQIPDVSFVSIERSPEIPHEFEGGPDLAVEVISPSETSTTIMKKNRRYIDAGTKIVWNVYPDEEIVYVYRPAEAGMNVQQFGINDTLDCAEVLPEFSLKVNAIFK
jgi:Uma2 family endonuclease